MGASCVASKSNARHYKPLTNLVLCWPLSSLCGACVAMLYLGTLLPMSSLCGNGLCGWTLPLEAVV